MAAVGLRSARRGAARLWRRAGRRARAGLRAIYYRALFDRPGPLARAAGRVVEGWERRDGRGDVPQSAAEWDRQYAAGRWAYMEAQREEIRYGAVVAALLAHAPRGAVLDVGCGEGILLRRYRPHGYSRYVGVDVSAAAVARLADLEDERTRFVCADAEGYAPEGPFDAVVCNESLYYLRAPFAAAARLCAALAPGGVLIVSTYTASPRAMAILRGLRRRMALREERLAAGQGRGFLCSVLAPAGAGVRP